MKIMTAMYTIKRGGAYDRFIMMLEGFLERNCEMYCLSLTPIPVRHAHFHNLILDFPLKAGDSFWARWIVFSIFPLWSFWVAWKNKIDVIIAFGSLYAFLQSFSKWILKRPMVTFIRGNFWFGLTMQNSPKFFLHLNKIVEYIGLQFSDRIITNNEEARGEILKRIGKKKNIDVQVLYNNIPPMKICEPENISQTRGRYGIPRDAKVLVTAGILTRGKNIERLIECLTKIEVRDIYLLIVGEGSTKADLDYKGFLQELTKRLGVDKRVLFTGWLEKEEVWKIYLASDLFVLPSLSEGMPNALLEALGAGLACVGNNIPGIKDILQYDDLLFEALDGKNMTDKIGRILSDRHYFEKVKRFCEARQEPFRFDWRERLFQTIHQ